MKFRDDIGPFTFPDGTVYALINDTAYWIRNESDILAWIAQSGCSCEVSGMVLHFGTQSDKTMFMLRWN